MSNVVFELTGSWAGRKRRYLVETRGEKASWVYPNRWYSDRYYAELGSAISRAENLLHKGVEDVRVIDTELEED